MKKHVLVLAASAFVLAFGASDIARCRLIALNVDVAVVSSFLARADEVIE